MNQARRHSIAQLTRSHDRTVAPTHSRQTLSPCLRLCLTHAPKMLSDLHANIHQSPSFTQIPPHPMQNSEIGWPCPRASSNITKRRSRSSVVAASRRFPSCDALQCDICLRRDSVGACQDCHVMSLHNKHSSRWVPDILPVYKMHEVFVA